MPFVASAHEVYVLDTGTIVRDIIGVSPNPFTEVLADPHQFIFWGIVGVILVSTVFALSISHTLERIFDPFFARLKPYATPIARITLGICLIASAYNSALFGPEIPFASFGAWGSILPLVLYLAGILITLGLFTRYAAALCLLVFLGAFATYHTYMLTYANYLQALATSKILDPKVKEKKIDAGAMTFEKFKAAMAETPNAWVKTLHDDLAQCLAEYDLMGKAFDAKCGADAPPSSAIVALLTAVLDAVKDVARDKLAITQQVAAEDEKPTADGKTTKEDGDATPGEKLPVIRNREDALNAVLKLADYFRRIEPHSMVPATLEQAVRWGRMPLTDLLTELIGDDDTRKALFKQVGIRGAEPAGDEDPKKKKR